MKTFVAVFCLVASLTCAPAQGLVNFYNNSSTLVSVTVNGISLIDGARQSWFFGLLTSPVGANTFTFAGIYATNIGVAGSAGLFNGGAGVSVNGWAPGTARDFEVIGWSVMGGVVFNPSWLTEPSGGYVGETIYWGFSAIGTGVAGGVTSSGTLPSLDIFGGTGIQTGFTIEYATLVPEPSSLSLATLGATSVLLFRRRRGRTSTCRPTPR
jgi:hypothetical protein